MAELNTSVLYYGDNLDVLRRHIPDESTRSPFAQAPLEREEAKQGELMR